MMLTELKQHKIVAIVRGVPAELADRTADALAEGGVRLIEVTMNSEAALATITRWRERYAGTLRVGAGTVLDVAMAGAAVDAGAEFIIAPGLDEAVVRYVAERGVEAWPGALSPTEIVRAWQAGASAVKVFPLGMLGTQYLKDLRGPLPHIPIMAVGGVNLDNVADLLRAGAIAAGIGSSLVNLKLIHSGKFSELRDLAARYVAAVSST